MFTYIKLLSLLFIVFFSSLALGQSIFSKRANEICSLITADPQFNYEELFNAGFRTAVPKEYFAKILKDIHSSNGKCKSTILKPNSELSGSFLAVMEKGAARLRFNISLEKKDNNLIAGLLFKGRINAKYTFKEYSEITKIIKSIKAASSLIVMNLDNDKEIYNYNGDKSQALGSEFKLYILGALADKLKNEKISWDELVTIKDSLKSLPGGTMQNEKEGSKFSLQHFANQMISISDNTATDHLHDFVGRKNIEKTLVEPLNSFAGRNIPFLSTMELFRLRTLKSPEVDLYVSFNEMERMKLLNRINSMSRDEVLANLGDWTGPRDISKIEWFASKKNMCQVMKWLKNKNSSEVFQALSINTPFIEMKENKWFQFAGYKGGSEPGVLEMTYLLQSKKGAWLCFSIGSNNQENNIDSEIYNDLVMSVIELIGKKSL